jgi:xanthine dehydrogenase accessory factor
MWMERLAELSRQGQPLVVATVARVSGSTPREAGAKMIILADGTIHGTVGGGYLEKEAMDKARQVFADGQTRLVKILLTEETGQRCSGEAEVLLEAVNMGPSLHVFGAGHVGIALAKALQGTPFTVNLIDDRAEWIDSPEIPRGARRHKESWKDYVARADWRADKSFVVIMTFGHLHDEAILEALLPRPTRYIGLMGSRAKWADMQKSLIAKGASAARLGEVRCPVGLSLGGKTPAEIAISISAEMLQELYGK